MFPSGSFAVTLQCSHQCDHSVPGLENLKRTKVMHQRCSKSVHLQCPGSVSAVYCFWENFGKFWEHCKHISNVSSFAVFLACACSVPRISPNFPKSSTLCQELIFKTFFFRLFSQPFTLLPSIFI